MRWSERPSMSFENKNIFQNTPPNIISGLDGEGKLIQKYRK